MLFLLYIPLCNRSICASLLNHYFSWWWYICAIVCMTQGIDRAFRGVAPRADRHPRRWDADKRLVCSYPVGPLSMATYPDQHHLLYLFATWNPKALECLHFRQWRKGHMFNKIRFCMPWRGMHYLPEVNGAWPSVHEYAQTWWFMGPTTRTG